MQDRDRLVIGVDVDGVLASFDLGYKRKLWEVTGKRLLPDDEEPPCWYWPEAVGYSKEEDSEAWKRIKEDPMFWATLKPLPGAKLAIEALNWMRLAGHEIYFMTVRMGISPQLQTQHWLEEMGAYGPMVLIARGEKGHMAAGLGLTHFIDDKPENIASVLAHSPLTKATLLSCRYNQHCHQSPEFGRMTVAKNLAEFIDSIGAYAKS